VTDATGPGGITFGVPCVAPVMTEKLVLVRPLEATDADALRDLFFRLSPSTRYLRFFQAVPEPSPGALRHLAAVDHHAREAVAAVVDGQIIGVARYDRLKDDPERAEMAVVVEDAWKGHGVGVRLMQELTGRALAEGVKFFTASVLGENHRMLEIVRTMAPKRHASIDHGVWDIEFPLIAS
jgi:GNAT superfamily N-acetyltransferase